jgi:hypothetical protein
MKECGKRIHIHIHEHLFERNFSPLFTTYTYACTFFHRLGSTCTHRQHRVICFSLLSFGLFLSKNLNLSVLVDCLILPNISTRQKIDYFVYVPSFVLINFFLLIRRLLHLLLLSMHVCFVYLSPWFSYVHIVFSIRSVLCVCLRACVFERRMQ